MNAVELKSDLHSLIDNVNDLNVLQTVREMLKQKSGKETDWADEMSDELRKELEASIKEANEGKTISHEEAMSQIKSRYKLT